MGSLRSRVESWIKDQTARIGVAWPPPPPEWRWPPWKGRHDRRDQERRIREELERRLHDLCCAVKADSVADLQEVLCSMVLSECVYKRPATEMIRFINKFKSDFGGHIVSLERVQPSLDHVPHRYLLAEAGDTLFASFIGTKQYKDIIADANILQGAIFHDDKDEDFDLIDAVELESDQIGSQKKIEENFGKSGQVKSKQLKKNSRPAAHRGFLARANGIPALELYKLAQKKNRKLVLCGHSLGGAVAALATLAILRILATSPLSKEHDKVQVKCITFSQPPVGNADLRDYVHKKGWRDHFKTYCIPEDLVPRILSPAYFHHYSTQTVQTSFDAGFTGTSFVKREEGTKKTSLETLKKIDGKQLVLGLGPVQTSFWRLLKLVPLEAVQKHLHVFRKGGNKNEEASSIPDSGMQSMIDETEAEPQPLEIQEGPDGISLNPLPDADKGLIEANSSQIYGKSSAGAGNSKRWRRVPYLPSYVPFGQLYLLGNSSVESLSDAEYSKLTSVRSVIAELKERFQSHSMKSYRSRFQKVYDLCMCINSSLFLGIEQLPQFPHLQQLLGLRAAGTVELGHIVEPPVIHTATSIVPLGWSGVPGEKNAEQLKVDIVGHGLHLCTLVQARVNGNWCSITVDSSPSMPPYSPSHDMQPDLQRMRIIIDAPLKQPPKFPVVDDSLLPVFSSEVTECASSSRESQIGSPFEERSVWSCSDGLKGFVVYCTSDFITVSKEVHVRTRRVRLLGLEGAGKTSLLKAILSQHRKRNGANPESIFPDVHIEGVADGLCYLDSRGVNLQELHLEAARFKEELQIGSCDLSRKTDLIILVHNLSQKIPYYHPSNASQPQPALSVLLNEAKALDIPWVLAITNKFSVSTHQQKILINSAMEAYQAPASMTEVINSCPFVMASSVSSLQSVSSEEENLSRKGAAQSIIFAPINLARMPFQKKPLVMPEQGVTALRQLVHHVIRSHEEVAFQELANERLSLELARQQKTSVEARHDSQGKGNSITAAAVGASLGAGLGLVMP
ncbi:uncharacterized protein LOC103722760 isoform X2 [Phoenix dactylifera]|uniref:Uncharacterized protein LOC103722760 isoform X2 n=1 Tax=Phoenix dactylifera TaxID=42345 RepID=A0A8B7D2H3_PHODC|nr:uncharacterized protein LOC103722760 isoform X2 [Phoenix dactylifera]